MLFKLSSLIGYALKTPELDLGPADDFYLDDLTLEVPYAKTRELPWFRFERLLVSMKAAASVAAKEKSIKVAASGEEITGEPSALSGAEHLRSCRELLKYRFRAEDESVGLVEEMLTDENWKLRYWLVGVDWPSGRNVLVPASMTELIDGEDKAINLSLRAEDVKNSPRVDAGGVVDQDDERLVDDYYRRLGRAA